MDEGSSATLKSSCLPTVIEKFRLETVRAFMCCACPLKYIDGLRPFLERHGMNVGTHSSNLGQYIPDVATSERIAIQQEFQNSVYSLVSFFTDGTQHHGAEVCNVVARWINTSTFQPVQRLVHLGFLKNSMDVNAIVAEVRIAKEKLTSTGPASELQAVPIPVAIHHDRVSANYAAGRTLKEKHNWHLVTIGCVPHTIDNAGKKFETPTLTKMQKSLNAMLRISLKIKVHLTSHYL